MASDAPSSKHYVQLKSRTMKYYSTNHKAPLAALEEAVTHSLAPDRGLYMPERIAKMPDSFFAEIQDMTFQEIAFEVAKTFFAEDIKVSELKTIVADALTFDCPVVEVGKDIWSLELFHGPTLAFKDVGARFMARMLGHFVKNGSYTGAGKINVLVATSGDTGSAVANGFLDVDGVHVYVLYPKGKVSPMQESQFATLGRNITAIEVDGTFDDCQSLVKEASADTGLNSKLMLTSANSINVARLLPQAFYYFNAYALMKKKGLADELVISVPSGNFGNITAGLIAKRMGLPIKRFIAANNANDVFLNYLNTSKYEPRPSIQTVANAMDVGAPSNFARVIDLYGGSHDAICSDISGAAYSDKQIMQAMACCLKRNDYLPDPHGACAWQALIDGIKPGEVGLFLETAHPAKFATIVERATNVRIDIPQRLAAFSTRQKLSIPMRADYNDFKHLLEADC